MVNAPVLHVNGDYPEGKSSSGRIVCFLGRSLDVARAMDIAFRYRNYFRKVSKHRCGLAEAKRLCRISSWIFWYTDDGELLHDRLFSVNSREI